MTDPLVGTSIGSYRFERVLGEGGMGRVYAAHTDAGAAVAIKVIAFEHAHDRELVDRFFAEARAATQISHENIVKVFDLIHLADGRPAIVMERVEGTTLRQLVRSGPLPLGGVVDVMVQVLDVLAATHAVDIVHRDLKPDNILVTAAGRVKVLDFGIAKLARTQPGQPLPRTRTGAILGTPEYMAPEQISGGNIDARTDLYAAGVVLFEACTGKRPFDGDSDFLVMRAHLEDPPPDPIALRADLPLPLAQVILTTLAKKREHRFGSAKAMMTALLQASASLPASQWRDLGRTRSITPSVAPSSARPGSSSAPPPRRSDAQLSSLATRADRPSNVAPQAKSKSKSPPPKRSYAVLVLGSIAVIGICIAIGMLAAVKRSSSTPAAKTSPPPPTATASAAAPPVANSAFAIPPRHYTGPLTRPERGNHRLLPPPPDPAHVDISRFLREAYAMALHSTPDAQMGFFRVQDVRSDGTIDVRGRPVALSVLFISPSIAAARPATVPANQEHVRWCIVNVNADERDTTIVWGYSGACETYKSQPMPECTVKEVWERAIERGADPALVAEVQYDNGRWRLEIEHAGRADLELDIADDCR